MDLRFRSLAILSKVPVVDFSCTDSDFAFKTIAVGQNLTVARQGKLIPNKSHVITPFATLLFDSILM